MQRLMCCGVAVLLTAIVCCAEGKHLFILSGQSNMVGLDHTVSFAPAVYKAFGKDNVIIVKSAASARSIRSWVKEVLEDPPPTEGQIPKAWGYLYPGLMHRVKGAIKDKTIQSVTLVWMQGESNKRNPAYREYLEALLKQLQDDLGRKDINVVS